MKSLTLRKEAEEDIHNAFQWYNSKRQGLGSDLLLCVEEGFSRITRSPKQFPCVHRDVRRAFIRRFPFGIYFQENDTQIIVFAFLHVRRHPDFFKSRVTNV